SGLSTNATGFLNTTLPTGGTAGQAQTNPELAAYYNAVANQDFGGSLAGTLTLTGGVGGMGGAQPLAITMNDGAALCIDVDATRLQRRVDHRYLDIWTSNVDEAISLALKAKEERRGYSVGLLGNAATLFTDFLKRGVPIDIVTDQTSAHDPLSYLPEGVSVDEWHQLAQRDPEATTPRWRPYTRHHLHHRSSGERALDVSLQRRQPDVPPARC
ncbi:MAG: hypothetical protein EBY80_11365, partial [Actinobacteria bacterium]|nr:hypothetical protein [Actinomycetota bacterium]